jgi:hypothetical protein
MLVPLPNGYAFSCSCERIARCDGTADPRGYTRNDTGYIPGFATEIDATEVKEGGTDGKVGASSRSY